MKGLLATGDLRSELDVVLAPSRRPRQVFFAPARSLRSAGRSPAGVEWRRENGFSAPPIGRRPPRTAVLVRVRWPRISGADVEVKVLGLRELPDTELHRSSKHLFFDFVGD